MNRAWTPCALASSLTAFLLLFAVSCGRSPQVYLERGNQAFAARKFDEAALNYRKAVQKDSHFGEAFYRLGQTEIQRKDLPQAYSALTSAAQLLPDRVEVQVALADLVLAAYMGDRRRPARYYQQLTTLSSRLLARNPNSFDGLRIKGNLAWSDGKLKEAAELFAKANLLKPLEPNLVPALTQVLFLDGRFEDGERLALEFLGKHKDSRQIYDVLYAHYMAQKRPADAENILKAKVRNNPAEIDYALQLASYYAAAGKRDEMAAVLRSVSNPAVFPNTYLKTGDFYSAHQEWPEALRQYERGASADRGQRITYLKRTADVWMAQGKGEQAAGVVREILKEQPGDETARAVNAAFLLKKGKVDESLATFRDLVKTNPDNAMWRLSFGRALVAKGDPDSAKAQFQEALKRHPDFLPARLEMADVSRIKHDYIETLRYADQAVAVNPRLLAARLLRATGLIGTQQYAAARAYLADLEKDYPQNHEVQFQLAALDLAQKKYPAAEARLMKQYADGKGDARALAILVDVFLDEKRQDKALALLTAELKKSPDAARLHALLADTALRLHNYDLALEHYQFLAARGARSAQLQMRLGSVYEFKGDFSKAAASFQAARDLAPKDTAASIALGDSLRLAGRKSEAIASYRGALALEPENPAIMNKLAFLLVDSEGGLAEAQSLAERALQKTPKEADFADTLGLVYLKKRLDDSAVQVFQSLAKKYPDNPAFRYHYALALLDSGQKAKAKAELEEALPKKPSQEVRQGIETTLAKLK